MAKKYYAHTVAGDTSGSKWQPLAEHLRNVAKLARKFADDARPMDKAFADAAEAAGLLHDLGKYRPEFQEMLRGARGKGESTRHKQAGAAQALGQQLPNLAFAISGHHGGMPNRELLKELVLAPGGKDVSDAIWPIAKLECPELGKSFAPWGVGVDGLIADLHIRLLFSCLVDADWLDTAEHQGRASGLTPMPKPAALEARKRLNVVLQYVADRAANCRDPHIAAIRADVLEASINAARESSTMGLFSMSVPTGGGKTLSALAFALVHAEMHDLRRIIYVAPYLSIIEQNATVLRAALGADLEDGVVLEHHSVADSDGDSEDSSESQRMAENWDAPFIITTSVQFYESLFSNKPSRSRKLHNIARSVVILDECQTLPPGLIEPTRQMLRQVCEFLGSTIVLCTATQPAWDLPQVCEIIPNHLDLFSRLRRVCIVWPKPEAPPLGWAAVAMKMHERAQALCVVNTKAAARTLFGELRQIEGDNVFHLSTAMCPEHRLQVIAHVRDLLKRNQPCHLVSTQLIEAGVDIDFPLLLRELAPLESIVQAAGRCNREGLLKTVDGRPGGEVVVFRSIDGKLPADAWYRNGRAVVEQDFLAVGRESDIVRPEDLGEYFRRLYRTGHLDEQHIVADRRNLLFETVAAKYRLIEDTGTLAVVATNWKPGSERVEQLLGESRKYPRREICRALGRYQVNLFEMDQRRLAGTIVRDNPSGVNICTAPYDEHLGIIADSSAVGPLLV